MLPVQARTFLSVSRSLGLLQHNLVRKMAADSDEIKYPLKMERCINQVNLLGRVGNNPEQRGTDLNPVVLFSLATNNTYSKPGNTEEIFQDTQWHRIGAFLPSLRGKVLRLLKKGDRVFVSGKISYYVKKNEENPEISSTYCTIIADNVIYLSSPKDEVKQDIEEMV